MLPNHKPRSVESTDANFTAGPNGVSVPVAVRNIQWTVAVTSAGIGPKIKNAKTENSSAGSNLRNGNIGNDGCIRAGSITVIRAARAPITAAPVRLTLRLENRLSTIQTIKAAHRKSQLLNCYFMTIL